MGKLNSKPSKGAAKAAPKEEPKKRGRPSKKEG